MPRRYSSIPCGGCLRLSSAKEGEKMRLDDFDPNAIRVEGQRGIGVQRMAWLRKGLETGNEDACDAFADSRTRR
ncbi:MAG: hypothetical protein ACK442_11190 [Novosphingobium sp.]